MNDSRQRLPSLARRLRLGNALSRSSASRNAATAGAWRSRARRSAFTLVEVIATLIMLAAVFAVIGNLLVRVSQQSRSADRRRIAQEAVGNVLEELTARPWEAIASLPGDATTDETSADTTALSPELTSGLPGGAVMVDVTPDSMGEAKKIVVEVRWTEPSGQDVRPARLVTWVHRDGRDR